MRMQTFHIGMALRDAPKESMILIKKLYQTWNNNLFSGLQSSQENDSLDQLFATGYQHWFDTVRPSLLRYLAEPIPNTDLYPLLEKQVQLTDSLVNKNIWYGDIFY